MSPVVSEPQRLLAEAILCTLLFLVLIVSAFASPARAWYCSPDSEQQPWQHYTHWHGPLFETEYRYISGHTHSWGEHHHVWDIYEGGAFRETVHFNCGYP